MVIMGEEGKTLLSNWVRIGGEADTIAAGPRDADRPPRRAPCRRPPRPPPHAECRPEEEAPQAARPPRPPGRRRRCRRRPGPSRHRLRGKQVAECSTCLAFSNPCQRVPERMCLGACKHRFPALGLS